MRLSMFAQRPSRALKCPLSCSGDVTNHANLQDSNGQCNTACQEATWSFCLRGVEPRWERRVSEEGCQSSLGPEDPGLGSCWGRPPKVPPPLSSLTPTTILTPSLKAFFPLPEQLTEDGSSSCWWLPDLYGRTLGAEECASGPQQWDVSFQIFSTRLSRASI